MLEAWYPGEQGAMALAEILFGVTNPSGKLPVSIPKSAGQLPLYYSYKPSGRGYAYCDNDGKPLYPFGYGLSYTSFSLSGAACAADGNGFEISCSVTNTGKRAGAEVLQLYLGTHGCPVLRPLKELKAYARVALAPGETKRVTLRLTADDLSFYDENMVFGAHDARHTLALGTSSEEIAASFDTRVENGKCIVD